MKTRLLGAFAAVLLLLLPNVNYGQDAPDLGTTSTYALFSATGAFNNIGATTTVTGDVGTHVGAFNAFPPGILVGQRHVADPGSAQAAADVRVAYSYLDNVTCGKVIDITMGSGQILKPDVYCLGAASTLNGDLILDGEGDPSRIFIFKIDGALSTTTFSKVILKNSASICNVYWQINGQVQLGENSVFQGTIVANGAIILLDAASLFGRGLTQAGAISLQNNVVNLGVQTATPVITASGPTTLCPGGSVKLSGNKGGIWSTGATTPSITVTKAGDYFVKIKNSCGGSATSNHIIVTVNEGISCTFSGNDSFCPGESTELCVPASDASTYLWSTGATTNCITVSAAGKYTVTITNADGCISTCSKKVTIKPDAASTITANGPTTFCPGGSVKLSGNNGGIWSTGATTPSITVTKAGDYFVKNSCGGSATSNHIIVNVSGPSCTLTGNSNICCPGESTKICAPLSENSTYLWSNGETTNCITVSAAGKYTVTITNAEGCESVCSKTVTASSAPACNIAGKSTICEGSATTLCATYGKDFTYLWSNGETTRCIMVRKGGNYTATVTRSKQLSTICTKTVTETPAPSCLIEGSSTIIQGGSTQLCAPASANSTYLWSTGETTNCITASAAGDYSVTVTNEGGCKRTCKKIVKLTDAPFCDIEGSGILYPGQSTQLCTPYGKGFTYLWSNGATTRCITVNTPGDYSVTVNKSGSSTGTPGTPATCTKTVTVSSDLSCPITGKRTICEGETTRICAPYAKGNTYLWSNGATTRCIDVSAGGTYSATVTRDGNSDTCGKTISVAPISCGISGSSTLCQGTTSTLSGPSGTGYTYLWSTGATTRSILISSGGTYSLEASRNGCTNTCSKTVTVPMPACTIAGDGSLCEGESTELCAPYGYGYKYLWSTGATSRCITVDAAGKYSLAVTKNGCTNTCSKTVTENPIPSCSITGNLFPSAGETTTLCAPEGLSSYKWSTGETTRCIIVDCTGTYTVVSGSFDCLSSCSAFVDLPVNTNKISSSGRSAGSGAELNFNIEAYPNPFYSKATIEFHGAESDSHVVIELFSPTKNKIGTLFDGIAKPGGFYQVDVNAGDLPRGIYVYRITNGYQVINKKLILAR